MSGIILRIWTCNAFLIVFPSPTKVLGGQLVYRALMDATVIYESESVSRSVVSNSLQPHGL